MPTRPEIRRRFAQDLRAYKPDGGGVATGGTVATLVCAAWPIQKNEDESTEFDNWHLLRPTAALVPPVTGLPSDQVRQINPGLYAPRTGTFTVDRPYTNPPLATDVFELHGHGFEPWDGVDLLINAALKDIHVVVTVPFAPRTLTAPFSGNYTQNLTSGDGSSTTNIKIPALQQSGWVHSIDLQPAATVQKQVITVTGTGGSYVITYRGVPTTSLAYNAIGSAFQAALNLLPGLEAVTVSPPGTVGPFTVTMTGAPSQSPQLGVAAGTPPLTGGTVTTAITNQMGIVVPQSGKIDMDGPDVIFYADRYYEPGDYLYIRCRLPALAWCRASATAAWGSLSTGLSLEAHQALPPVEWISAGMQVWGWRRRPDLMQQGENQRNIANQAQAQADFDRYQDEFLRKIVRSPLLQYPVEGGETSAPSPLAALSRDVAPAAAGNRN